jgi:hypothetical protein
MLQPIKDASKESLYKKNNAKYKTRMEEKYL